MCMHLLGRWYLYRVELVKLFKSRRTSTPTRNSIIRDATVECQFQRWFRRRCPRISYPSRIATIREHPDKTQRTYPSRLSRCLKLIAKSHDIYYAREFENLHQPFGTHNIHYILTPMMEFNSVMVICLARSIAFPTCC